MSFNKIKNKLKQLKREYIGPDYDFVKHLPKPQDLGASDSGNFSALFKDIMALMKYVEILTFGDPPLGYNYFLRSGKCSNDRNGRPCKGINKCVNRYLYVRNIPTGNIPGLAQLGLRNTPFKGMVPGLAEDAGDLLKIPMKLWKDLSGSGPKPPNKCKLVRRTVGPAGGTHYETRWVPVLEPFISRNNELIVLGLLFLVIILYYFKKKYN